MRRNNEGEEVSLENIIVVPPDGGWGWVIVIAAFYCIFVMDGIANTYGLLLPIFQREFDATVSEVSLINSLFTGFYFLFGPVASSLSNRFGFRAVIISGSLVSAFGIGISVFNTSVQLMFLTYGFVGGLGFSLMYINVLLTVGFYFERWRALATGITVSASGAGTFSFAPAVQALLESYTWRHILIGYAGLIFLCSAVAICFRPLTPVRLKMDVDEANQLRTHGSSKRTVYSNVNYPTAAEVSNIGSNLESKTSLPTNLLGSLESLEVRGHHTRVYHSSATLPHAKRSGFGYLGTLDDIESASSAETRRCCRWKRTNCCQRKGTLGLRPMYRDDIFYDSSVGHVHAHERSMPSNRGSIATTTTTIDLQEEKDGKCHACPESTTRVLKTMFDFSIIKIPTFLFFLFSTSFLALGALVPVQFSYVRAVEMMIMDKDEASLMISALGITNTVGRIICGLIGSIRRVNIVLLHIVFLLFGVCLNTGVVFFTQKTALYIYATLYGLVLAEQGCLRSVILVKLVGLEKLTNAFGILLLFLGLFTIIGTPLAGYLKDVANSYDTVFYYSSVIFFLAAASCTPILFWKKCVGQEGHPIEATTSASQERQV